LPLLQFGSELVRQSIVQSVLPGPEAASPLIQQNITAIWRNQTAIQIFPKFLYFVLNTVFLAFSVH
jgi:hypothetical protein